MTHPWVAEGARRIRFGVVGNFVKDWPGHLRFATEAERLGYDSCCLFDHPNRLMECWTLMSALAASTRRIRLISMVSWWRGEEVTSRDGSGRLDGAWLRPGPVQEPHVPVLIGGGGERTTLRQVAELADVSNFAPHEWAGSAFDVSGVARKYGVLRDHCAAAGRPYQSILRSHFTPLLVLAEDEQQLARKQAATRIPDPDLTVRRVFATPPDAVKHYQALADAGVQYFIAGVNAADEETTHLLAEAVWPALQAGPETA
jgi:alkanesulfonate monooxygenase SsuD/methylene tetrahydromethanopterin reductase-like flavin-dependent oxidoreductase (luciferase family)